jgi:hypothetical protein
MEKQKQNKALDTVTDKVDEKEMRGGSSDKKISFSQIAKAIENEKPKIKPSEADLKLLKAKFVNCLIHKSFRNAQIIRLLIFTKKPMEILIRL